MVAESDSARKESELVDKRKRDEEELTEDSDFVKDDVSLDELFALKEMFQTGDTDEEEDEEVSSGKKKKSKKKKKKHVEIEYDEDLGEVIARKKHKRGGDDFDDHW